MKTIKLLTIIIATGFLLMPATTQVPVFGQDEPTKPKLNSDSKQARYYALSILDEIKDILKEYYFDENYRGMDLKARVDAAKARVKTLEYNWQMYRVIAQVLMELDDSHTSFILPRRTDHFRYGISWQMFGESCLITSVKKDSDAFAQGIEVGDEVISIRKLTPTRADLWKMNYVIYQLDPLKTMDLKIRKLDNTERTVTIQAKTLTDKEFRAELKEKREKLKARKEKNEYEPFRCREISTELVGCKLETFVVEKSDIDKMMKRASKYPKLILDLRQNSGGFVTIEEYLLSHFFDREVKIGDVISRKKPEVRKTKVLGKDRQYKGEVAVLVDSKSASAAEMTARVLQIEKRAKIYGDFTSGAVMTSIRVPFTKMLHMDTVIATNLFGMSVTIGDVVMSDGSRLEKIGVVPDEVLQPTGLALKMKLDAVLAYAAMKLGAQLTAEEAGKFYFITEKDEDDEDGSTTEEP
jgi:C-terminal processing protease CtpA/Prc